MKVLVISGMFPDSADPLVGRMVLCQTRALRDLGIEPLVLAPRPWVPGWAGLKPEWEKVRRISSEAVIEGIRVIYPRYLRLPGGWFYSLAARSVHRALLPVLENIRNQFRFDLIATHQVLPYGYAGVRLGQHFRLPHVCTGRGTDLNCPQRFGPEAVRLTAWTVGATDQLVTVSRALKRRAEELSAPLRPIKVVYTGLDHARFHPAADRAGLRKSLNLSADQPVILFVGALHRNKGVYELLENIARLAPRFPGLELLMIGGGEDRTVRAHAEVVGASSVTRFLGTLPNAVIADYMRASDVLVLPTYNEGVPNVVIEAMACGLPAVCTRVGGIPEVMEGELAGLLYELGDQDAFQKLVSMLLEDPPLRQKLGNAGIRLARQHFSWERNAREMRDIFQELERQKRQ